MFDIFREDLTSASEEGTLVENNYVEVSTAERSISTANNRYTSCDPMLFPLLYRPIYSSSFPASLNPFLTVLPSQPLFPLSSPHPHLPQCDPDGRTDDDQELVLVNPSKAVKQIGSDPLLILDDVMYVNYLYGCLH